MTKTEATFSPAFYIRNRHIQTFLASSDLRRRAGKNLLKNSGSKSRAITLELVDGIRLQSYLYEPASAPAVSLVVLIHGWEGSHESSYIQHSTALLLQQNIAVLQLNLRDHGDSHHLNAEIFHSCRIDEVMLAFKSIAALFPQLPLSTLGFSLGGNFALRIALNAPQYSIDLKHAVAICPVMHGASGLRALESGLGLYHWYFMRKWRRSLRLKRALFPDLHDHDEQVLAQDMRGLTEWLVKRHTTFENLQAYFDGYAVDGERLNKLKIPVSILTSADDPVIPIEDFHKLQLPAGSYLEISANGGHCGFIEDLSLNSYAERWAVNKLSAINNFSSGP